MVFFHVCLFMNNLIFLGIYIFSRGNYKKIVVQINVAVISPFTESKSVESFKVLAFC